jgi:hypothetical protein
MSCRNAVNAQKVALYRGSNGELVSIVSCFSISASYVGLTAVRGATLLKDGATLLKDKDRVGRCEDRKVTSHTPTMQ